MTGLEVITPDGEILRRGMAVRCGGYSWVVGYASRPLTLLDRQDEQGRRYSMLVGHRRLGCVHIEGWQIPQIFHD